MLYFLSKCDVSSFRSKAFLVLDAVISNQDKKL
jgi:hypothetical protein